jgi:hypothetical protein
MKLEDQNYKEICALITTMKKILKMAKALKKRPKWVFSSSYQSTYFLEYGVERQCINIPYTYTNYLMCYWIVQHHKTKSVIIYVG